MTLSPQEMAELEALRIEFSGARDPGQISEMDYSVGGVKAGGSSVPAQQSNLSKEEEAELVSLRQEFSQPKQVSSSFMDRAQTQIESFGNAITLGYLPQIQAGFEKVNNFIGDPSGGVDAQLEAQGFQLPKQDYVNLRDENLKRQEGQAQRNPYDAMAGTIGGIAVQAPLIAATAVPKAAGMAARVGSSIATGFGLGAVSNPGDTEGVVSPLQGQERLTNAAMGGAFGAGGQLLGEGFAKVGNVIKNSPATLSKFSNLVGFKSIGAGKPDFKKAFGTNSPEDVGETLIRLGVIKPGASVQDMLPEIQAIKKATGQELGAIYKNSTAFVNDASGVSKLSTHNKFLLKQTQLSGDKLSKIAETRITKEFKNSLDNSQVKDRVVGIFENLKNAGDDIQITDMHEMIRNLDDSINWSQKAQEATVIQDQLRSVRNVLSRSLKNRVDAVGRAIGKPDQIKALKELNKQYGQMATAERVAQSKITQENANRFFSLTDYIVGGGSGAAMADGDTSPEGLVKKAIYGFAGAVANKGMRKYSLPMVASSAKKMSELMQRPATFAKFGEPLIEAAKRSPQEFQALFNQFGKEPEFIKLAKPLGAR